MSRPDLEDMSRAELMDEVCGERKVLGDVIRENIALKARLRELEDATRWRDCVDEEPRDGQCVLYWSAEDQCVRIAEHVFGDMYESVFSFSSSSGRNHVIGGKWLPLPPPPTKETT